MIWVILRHVIGKDEHTVLAESGEIEINKFIRCDLMHSFVKLLEREAGRWIEMDITKDDLCM